MTARDWSVGLAPKAAPVLAMMAVLVGLGMSVASPAAPAGRAPQVLPISAPALGAAERAPMLVPLHAASRAATKWCAGPSGVRIEVPPVSWTPGLGCCRHRLLKRHGTQIPQRGVPPQLI
ncbi:MAG: hypothetical protein ACREOJ_02465, partial [Gemmatimonadaceae bacterium]